MTELAAGGAMPGRSGDALAGGAAGFGATGAPGAPGLAAGAGGGLAGWGGMLAGRGTGDIVPGGNVELGLICGGAEGAG